MFENRVEADFAAAHFLRDYHGKCENLHGHNYKVYAHIRGTELDEGGMLLDFTILKGALRKICAMLDHTNLNDLTENGEPVFMQNPSAERIAKWIFDKLRDELENCGMQNAAQQGSKKNAASMLYAVDVFETPGSRARYTEP
ncbi:MAG: 6-carboxytetrahydropterin synthase QueD [Treponemataceae bacterium]|nr:6-carboxytetrahydropterin synthase QueD [Treponemataceae bacterium]